MLIVIDTLQRIRKVSADANPYASDYRDIGILKQLADKHRIAILLIHHLRKMNDDDPMFRHNRHQRFSTACFCFTTTSYKNKKRIERPKSEQLRFENTHEPLVTKETWDIVCLARGHLR